jgi:hypothetical protein
MNLSQLLLRFGMDNQWKHGDIRFNNVVICQYRCELRLIESSHAITLACTNPKVSLLELRKVFAPLLIE